MTYTDYTTLLAERDDLKARLAEAEQLREQILNFPNLRAMREAMVAAADENKELLAKLAERDAEIAKNGRHAMRVTISQLEARLAEKDETISRMQGLLETCDEVMEALRTRLAEAERLLIDVHPWIDRRTMPVLMEKSRDVILARLNAVIDAARADAGSSTRR